MTAMPPRTTTPTGWARSYANTPGKAARYLRWARGQAQQARQDGNQVDADYYEEVGDALEAVLGSKTRCRICGLRLDDPVSVARGIGPDCWAKQP